jgi:hypothetical protein
MQTFFCQHPYVTAGAYASGITLWVTLLPLTCYAIYAWRQGGKTDKNYKGWN